MLIGFVAVVFPACDTQKPANEVKDAQDRVEDKVLDARSTQDDPALQEAAGSVSEEETPAEEQPLE